MNANLTFKGRCEEAFRCDQQAFGGQLGTIFRYGGSPMAGQVPADWQDKVMHTTLTVDGQMLLGGDVAPDQYEEPKGFSMSLTMTSEVDAERNLQGACEGWPCDHGAAKDVLDSAFRPRRRSLRDRVVDQLRIGAAARRVGEQERDLYITEDTTRA